MLRQITKSSFLLTFLVIACLLSGCKKDEMSTPNFTLPEVKTVEIFQIGRLFKCRGQILSDSSSPIIERGICYDTFPFPPQPIVLKNSVILILTLRIKTILTFLQLN